MNTQISLSFELICLLSWLLKNEQAMLNTLIKHAVEHGFAEEIGKIDETDYLKVSDHLYDTVLDFLDFLEKNMIKNLETIQIDHKTKDVILPTLQKIEAGSMDFKTIWLSMQQTKARVGKTHTVAPENIQNPTEILFERLLKNWKPNNKETLN